MSSRMSPAFGAPDPAMQSSEGSDAVPQTVTPNDWQNAGGRSSTKEFAQNRSLVVAAGQDVEQPYLNSLAITFPTRGKEFYFPTPRGGAVLGAHGVSKSIVPKSIALIVLVIGVVLLIKTRSVDVAAADGRRGVGRWDGGLGLRGPGRRFHEPGP